MCALGCPPPGQETCDWAHTHGDTFTALGHTLGNDGRIAPCVSSTLASMWRCFFGNFGKSMCTAPLDMKLAQLKRCVLPIASYRMPRWPYQVHSAKRLDRTQAKMTRILIGTRVYEGEDPATFLRRRNRLAAVTARQQGKWSQVWARRVVDWSSHLQRDRNHSS